MISFESEIVIVVVLASMVIGVTAPYILRLVHKLGWIRIGGKTYDELHSRQDL